MSVENLMSIHPVVVEIFQSDPSGGWINLPINQFAEWETRETDDDKLIEGKEPEMKEREEGDGENWMRGMKNWNRIRKKRKLMRGEDGDTCLPQIQLDLMICLFSVHMSSISNIPFQSVK